MSTLPCCSDLAPCELAHRVKVPLRTIYRRAHAGWLGAYQTPGGSWRFSRRRFDAWLAGRAA